MGTVGIIHLWGRWVDNRLHAARAFLPLGSLVVLDFWFGSWLDVGHRSPTGSVACVRCGGWAVVRMRLWIGMG